MASSNNPMSSPNLNDPSSSSSTVFVQADPSNFRLIVQKLTGAPPLPSSITTSAAAAATCHERPPSFKLHERRQQRIMKKLEVNFSHLHRGKRYRGSPPPCFSTIVSPVSTLDQAFFCNKSPRITEEEGEETAVDEKGLYLHPSPLCPPRETPQLLHLFPLQSSLDPDN